MTEEKKETASAKKPSKLSLKGNVDASKLKRANSGSGVTVEVRRSR